MGGDEPKPTRRAQNALTHQQPHADATILECSYVGLRNRRIDHAKMAHLVFRQVELGAAAFWLS
jgi:hypothetical protein